jgi:hypothetical protein
MKFDDVSKLIEEIGIPGRDDYALQSSGKTFPDGCHWRIEIAGVDGPAQLELLIKERKKWDIPVHRVISFNPGPVLYSSQEIRDFAQLAAEDKIEVVSAHAPRPGWSIGRQFLGSEGSHDGAHSIRGSDMLRQIVSNLFWLYDLGIRGFFLTDPGLLYIISSMQKKGSFPKDVTIKVGVGGGVANAASAKVFESLGASSVNPQSDHPLCQLASIRKSINIPIDFYIWTFASFGGENRIFDAPEVAKICAPTYFKFEPAVDSGVTYNGYTYPDSHFFDITEKKIKWAKWVVDHVKENAPELKLSQQGPADLRIPVVK